MFCLIDHCEVIEAQVVQCKAPSHRCPLDADWAALGDMTSQEPGGL